MDQARVRTLLADVRAGALSIDDAVERLRGLPFEDLGFARVDHHRELRSGLPEVIFGAGKTPAEIADIAAAMTARSGAGLVTRASPESYEAVRARIPGATYAERSRLIRWGRRAALAAPTAPGAPAGPIAVTSAGTSDLPVAEEAALTAEWLGHEVVRVVDIGVAGVHRTLEARPVLDRAAVVIVVAGMEGALASVVAGLIRAPVVAVPTSVGYGASFEGLAALLAMLSSCVPGIAVVNIDNGFGAAALAHRILTGRPS